MRSGRTAGGRSKASSGAGRAQGAGRVVVILMLLREDLGTAHLHTPPPPGLGHRGRQVAGAYLPAKGGARARRTAAASFCRVGGGRGGPAGASPPPHPFPLPPCDPGGSYLPKGQEVMGMCA